jgi:uncharacterized protein
MTPTIPMITPIYAAILGLLGAALTANVIAARVATGVAAGDGSMARLARAIRAHANFVEQAPIALILIAFAETLAARPIVVNVLGIALIASRLASATALNRSLGQSALRQFGGGTSVLIAAAAAITILLALAGVR